MSVFLWAERTSLNSANQMRDGCVRWSGKQLGGPVQGSAAVARYWPRCLIKTKTQTSPGARVFRFATCQALRPLERGPRQSSPFEDRGAASLAFWSAPLGKSTAWRVQGRGLAWDSGGVGRRGETHSTLINTWPHYLSHVAGSHWGKV